MTDKNAALFDDATLAPVPVPVELIPGPTLRCVYWGDDARVCLVRCDHGERNVKTVRKIATLCGTSCAEVARTSSIPPAKQPYCQTCVANAGSGVLR